MAVAVSLGTGVQVSVGVDVAVGTWVGTTIVGGGLVLVGVGELQAASARRRTAKARLGCAIILEKRRNMGLIRRGPRKHRHRHVNSLLVDAAFWCLPLQSWGVRAPL